jgi:hypothetical protein
MSFLATTLIALILEFAPPGPGYVVYPVADIVQDPPRFNNSPRFGLRDKNNHRGQGGRFGKRDDGKREKARGFSQDEKEMVDMIKTLIEEELKARKIEAKVFFMRGNFIVRIAKLSDMKKLERESRKPEGPKGRKKNHQRSRQSPKK